MGTHADKVQKHNHQISDSLNIQKQNNSNPRSTFHFKDNRPETVLQRKRQILVDRSPQVSQLQSVQTMANATVSRQQSPVQLDGDASSAQIHQAADRGIRTPPTALPYAEEIQRSFGRHDISGIQFHSGPEAAESACVMNARAYSTAGHVVSDGSISKHTAAHEAAHVIQQQSGVQLKDNIGSVGDKYERHADAVADTVVSGHSAEPLLTQPSTNVTYTASSQTNTTVVQRLLKLGEEEITKGYRRRHNLVETGSLRQEKPSLIPAAGEMLTEADRDNHERLEDLVRVTDEIWSRMINFQAIAGKGDADQEKMKRHLMKVIEGSTVKPAGQNDVQPRRYYEVVVDSDRELALYLSTWLNQKSARRKDRSTANEWALSSDVRARIHAVKNSIVVWLNRKKPLYRREKGWMKRPDPLTEGSRFGKQYSYFVQAGNFSLGAGSSHNPSGRWQASGDMDDITQMIKDVAYIVDAAEEILRENSDIPVERSAFYRDETDQMQPEYQHVFEKMKTSGVDSLSPEEKRLAHEAIGTTKKTQINHQSLMLTDARRRGEPVRAGMSNTTNRTMNILKNIVGIRARDMDAVAKGMVILWTFYYPKGHFLQSHTRFETMDVAARYTGISDPVEIPTSAHGSTRTRS